MLNRSPQSRTITARMKNKRRARRNRVGRRTQSAARFPLVSLSNRFPHPLSSSPCLRFVTLFSCFSKSLCSSQAARRDQNRIAQREFRLRKQQRVCDRFCNPLLPRWRDGCRPDGLVDIPGFVRSAISKHPLRCSPVERMLHSPRCARSSKVSRHMLRISPFVVQSGSRSHG